MNRRIARKVLARDHAASVGQLYITLLSFSRGDSGWRWSRVRRILKHCLCNKYPCSPGYSAQTMKRAAMICARHRDEPAGRYQRLASLKLMEQP